MAERDKRIVINLLRHAGIEINGKKPYDIQVHDERFYRRALRHQGLGIGEAYMDGWWEAKSIDQLITRVLNAELENKVRTSPEIILLGLSTLITNRQTTRRARKNAAHHYNIGNDLYERMLDKRMIYSCGYWKNAKTLDDAQEAKLKLICDKLELKKGMTLLDIGCGWGGFSEYAARNYGVKVTGISPASEQVKLARKRTKSLSVKIEQKDYRDMTGNFDRIVSIGMLEHVGYKNYNKFFDICRKLLKDDGLMLHHTIGSNASVRSGDPWMDRYIFPGGNLPSIAQISKAVENKLIIEDIHNIGPDYDNTLMAWHKNFMKYWGEIEDFYDERFKRMWEYYLLSCAAGFRSRNLQLWQIVMRPRVQTPTYRSVR
ncbi:cyclopropane fatty acyl phospholipid synthase [Candidatus Saccharibacteria bacterium]|nr:cyclopropane fatty acyl phospholipid synthase [Candidatus Saccharibacteria bacterium]